MADPFTLTIPTKRYGGHSSTYSHVSQQMASSSNNGGFGGNVLAEAIQERTERTSPLLSAVVPAVAAAVATAGVVISAHKLWSRYRLKKSHSCPDFNTIQEDDSRSGTGVGHQSPPPRAGALRGPGVSPRGRNINNNNFLTPSPTPNPLHIPIANPGDNPALRSSRSQHRSVRERDQYEKMREIGRGAFGVVYIGRHIRTGELVAIKEMEVQGADELRTEFQIMEHLNHDNIVTVKGFEVGKRHARLYLEWVAGGSLAEILKHRHIEDERLVACYIRQILEGLAYLHEHDILHRDIKPRNILVDHKGALKLTDFGLSRHLQSMQDRTKCAGTPIYMSPEVMHGKFSVGSDIWALGATMSEMITGKLPWSHIDPAIFGSQVALMMHIAKFEGDKGHHPIIPNILSLECRAFMEKCFDPKPTDRGTCRELLEHPFLATDFEDMRSPVVSEASKGQGDSRGSRKTRSTREPSGADLGVEDEDYTEASGMENDSFDSDESISSQETRRAPLTHDTPAAPNTATCGMPPLLTASQRGAGPDATTVSLCSQGQGSPSENGTPGYVAGRDTNSLASEPPKSAV